MSLLPGPRPSIKTTQDGAIQIRNLVEEEASEIFQALAAEKSRAVLQEIYAEPGTASAIADRLDSSLQNTMYHLKKLEATGLVRVAGIQYSSRGKEMDVYAPSESPVVIFVGTESRKRGLYRILKNFAGSIAISCGAGLFAYVALMGTFPSMSLIQDDSFAIPGVILAGFLGGIVSILLYTMFKPQSPHGPSSVFTTEIPHNQTRLGVQSGGAGSSLLVQVASLFFTVSLLFWFARQAFGLVYTLQFGTLLPLLGMVSALVAAGVAYRGASVIGCWTVAGSGIAGILGHQIAVVFGGLLPPSLAAWVAYITLGAIGGGVVFGTIGFVLGQVMTLVRRPNYQPDW